MRQPCVLQYLVEAVRIKGSANYYNPHTAIYSTMLMIAEETYRDGKWISILGRHEEDFPGQHNDIRRQEVINGAVEAADDIIMEGSNGDEEETDYLTSAVAKKFLGKVHERIQAQLLRKDLEKRFEKGK